MSGGGHSAHMVSMTNSAATKPETRTFEAAISVVAGRGREHETVVMPAGDTSLPLPLTRVEVALRANELFMATGGNGKTGYFDDLEEAWWFTRNNDSEGTPGAIVIVAPAIGKKDISYWNVVPIHDRAVAIVKELSA